MTSPPNLEQPRRRLTAAIVPALAVAALAGLVAMLMVGRFRDDTVAMIPEGCIIEGAELIGGPISLLDARGQMVTQADFAGEPAVVYFGFAHCPDICPTTMYQLAEALKLPGGFDIQPILISVDPERDTPELLDAYVHTSGFPDGLQGLTGSEAQVDAAARVFRVVRQKAPIDGAAPDVYNVDHTSFLYVMDGQWRTRAVLPTQGRSPEDIAACISAGLSAG
ncbi:MAG: SCO family protein [Hyphomonadaceae bacterium]|nr:SCO family protein [Hyphomonadaceae bacterium]